MDGLGAIIRGIPSNFNSRPSARGDKDWMQEKGLTRYFNSRPSARGDVKGVGVHGFSSYFNSRPSARGDKCINHTVSVEHISIHAPPRGATAGCITVVAVSSNFNSRPSARGDNSLKSEAVNSLFQFTPLREGRQAFVEFCLKKYAGISIHAPPRGATHQRERFSPSTLFQFTPLREGRR